MPDPPPPRGRSPRPPVTEALPGFGRLGIGTATLGRLYQPVTRVAAVDTLLAAERAGITFVDTAPSYAEGLAEARVGAYFSQRPDSPMLVSSKVGRVVDQLPPIDLHDPTAITMTPGRSRVDWSGAGIRASVEASLTRLGRDHLDVAYLHDPGEAEDEVCRVSYPALCRLREDGLVRAIGIGVNHADQATRMVNRIDLDIVLLAGQHTLLDHGVLAEFLPACVATDTAVVAAGVLGTGVLSTAAADQTYRYRPAPAEVVERAVRLRDLCAVHDVPLSAAAIQYPPGHPAVRAVVVGMRSADEVAANVAAFARPIPSGLWSDLVSAGLLPDGAPTPGTS